MESYHSKKKWHESDSHWNYRGSSPLSKTGMFNFIQITSETKYILKHCNTCINFLVKLIPVEAL